MEIKKQGKCSNLINNEDFDGLSKLGFLFYLIF